MLITEKQFIDMYNWLEVIINCPYDLTKRSKENITELLNEINNQQSDKLIEVKE